MKKLVSAALVAAALVAGGVSVASAVSAAPSADSGHSVAVGWWPKAATN
ncbi:hypothetical protein KIH31_12085 [Paenarthrobacter sp. DKR-5]|nr:hypothetical protein [Paenarthrobacter sp. DKR-5]MBT1003344.1 hypothetical protein [Paenarthrobacter sp. DKR-5]